MTRRAKRTLSSLLALTLALIMLVGCQSTTAPTSTTAAAADATASAVATTAPAAATSEPAATTTPPVKLVMYQQSWAKATDDPGNTRVKQAIDKALNIDLQIELQPASDAQSKFDLDLSSNNQLDIVIGMMPDFNLGYKNGAVAKLDDLLQKYGQDVLKIVPSDLWAICKADDGSIVQIPNPSLGEQSYFMVRNDLLTKYGLSKPTTLEEYEAYLAKAKADTGKVPVYFGASAQNIFKAMGGMYLANGYPSAGVGYDANGNVVNIIRVPGFKEMIAKIAEWYAKGYEPEDLVSWTADKKNTMFSTGAIASEISWASDGFSPYAADATSYFATHSDAYWVYLDPLTGGTTGKNAGTRELGYSGGVWIPAKSKVQDTAMKYLDWLLSDVDHYMLAAMNGVEGTDWEWTDKSKLTYKTIKNDLPAYVGSFYYFDFYGTQIKDVDAAPRMKLYYNMFDQYATHEKLVPVNPFKSAAYGLFSAANKDNNSTDLDAFITEQLQKFMSGARPISEWDAFIQDYLSRGGQVLDDARAKVWNDNKSKYGE